MKLYKLGEKIYEPEGGVNRIKAMEGIRGLAVLMVFCVHYNQQFSYLCSVESMQYILTHIIGEAGHAGVDLFFILSGYLIYGGAVKKNLILRRFWLRRIIRIYPTFLVVLLIYIGLSFFFPEKSKIPEDGFGKLVILSGNIFLLAGLFPVEPINTVTWSLSFEVFFYFVLPLVTVVTRMNVWDSRNRVMFFLSIASIYVVFFLAGILYRPGYWTHARMLLFIVGILLYERFSTTSGGAPSRPVEFIIILFFIFSLWLYYFLHELIIDANFHKYIPVMIICQVMVVSMSFYYFCVCAFLSGSLLNSVLLWSPIRWLGNMSYSYYLIHGLVIHFFGLISLGFLEKVNIGLSYGYWLIFPWVFLATLIVSTLLFILVEKPLSLNPLTKYNFTLFYKKIS